MHSNTVINLRSNMNGNSIRNMLNTVSCFSWPLQMSKLLSIVPKNQLKQNPFLVLLML